MRILYPQQTRALNSGVPGGIHAGMRLQQMLSRRAAPAFDYQDRLIARRASRRRDKTTRVAEVLKIKQNRTGFTVARQKIQQLINVDIQTVAESNEVGESHFTLLRPVEDGVRYRSRLRDKRELAFADRNRREAGI